jgi:hypothetical protein
MSLSRAALPLLLLGSLLSGPVRAEELSLKVENYIFAASEALDDGEPALALSLLRRARAEAPDSCIVEEYLCRCYLALGNADMAREAYGRFVSCMEVSDEGVLSELDALIVQVEQQADQLPAPEPASEPATPADSAPPAVVAAPILQSPEPASAGGRVGWVMLGSGAVVGVGGGVASLLTWRWGEHYVGERQQSEYEALAPYNHAAVIGAGVGGALAVTGLVVGLSGRSRDRALSATPWLASDQQLGLSARVEF